MAHSQRSGGHRLERIGLTIAATLVSINIWTGAPLLAVWVGSRVAPSGGPSMGAIVTVLAVLCALVFGLAALLTRLNAAYDRLTGRETVRRTTAWLRPMSGEREHPARRAGRMTPVERAAVLSVVLAVLTFEIWFFFFARYSIPGA